MTDRPARPRKPQITFEVLHRENLTPTMVRLYLGGPGFTEFVSNGHTDQYVKIYFVKPELGLEPPYDVRALRQELDPDDLPVTRTYTVREINTIEQWLSIDFVIHGAEGLAGPWAVAVQPGETVVLSGPGGKFSPDPAYDWHLFAGDEAALPAISAAIETLDDDASGVAFIEVANRDEEVPFQAPPGVDVHWLHRGEAPAGTSNILIDAVADYAWPSGEVQVFAHGEREAIKALRDVFFKDRQLQRSQVSISGYWALGRTEDRFQAEKREPVGQILSA